MTDHQNTPKTCRWRVHWRNSYTGQDGYDDVTAPTSHHAVWEAASGYLEYIVATMYSMASRSCQHREWEDEGMSADPHCFGAVGNCTEPPAYVWTGPHGGEYLLCVQHCAEWRVQTAATPIAPTRIRDYQQN